MKRIVNILIVIVVGLFAVAITNRFTSSKYPPCELVVQGIGVSTYGCSSTVNANYPCKSEAANSESMQRCIRANYYQSRTFPFGFTQYFGDSSNQTDAKLSLMNATLSFVTAAATYLATTYLIEYKKSSRKHQKPAYSGKVPR